MSVDSHGGRRGAAPPITREYLQDTVTAAEWTVAEQSVAALEQHFPSARFASEVDWGLLLVPDRKRIDTRRPMPTHVRRDQLREPVEDVFDSRLGPGSLAIPGSGDWALVATVVGPYGPACGSYQQVTAAPSDEFTVLGTDTRRLMTRQLWGARVLQAGQHPPDSDRNDRWTFTPVRR